MGRFSLHKPCYMRYCMSQRRQKDTSAFAISRTDNLLRATTKLPLAFISQLGISARNRQSLNFKADLQEGQSRPSVILTFCTFPDRCVYQAADIQSPNPTDWVSTAKHSESISDITGIGLEVHSVNVITVRVSLINTYHGLGLSPKEKTSTKT